MDDENWFPHDGPRPLNPEYEEVSERVRELSSILRGADQATVAAEQAKLREQAERITDESDRQAAISRVDKLPQLIRGPQPGKSQQYSQAVILAARVRGYEGSVPDRIAFAEQVKREIGQLGRQAPLEERGAIMRMNSDIIRLIRDLRAGTR